MLKLGVWKRTSHRWQSAQTGYNTMKKINWSPWESLAVKSDIVCSSNKMLTHEQKQFLKPGKKSRKVENQAKYLPAQAVYFIYFTHFTSYTRSRNSDKIWKSSTLLNKPWRLKSENDRNESIRECESSEMDKDDKRKKFATIQNFRLIITGDLLVWINKKVGVPW